MIGTDESRIHTKVMGAVLSLLPDPDHRLRQGDSLIIMTNPEDLGRFAAFMAGSA